jgi:hypothetical protein
MAGINLADSYRAAGLSPGPELLRLRQEPFEKLRAAVVAQTAVDLTRLYFGLSLPSGTDWFRDTFAENDPSFSMYDNQREAAVLAAGLLGAAITDGKIYAALAPLTCGGAGWREPVVHPELLDEARRAITAKAVKDRGRVPWNAQIIKLPVNSKVPTASAALGAQPDWPKTVALFNLVSDEAYSAVKNLVTETRSMTEMLADQIADLREEVDMLWWYVGGWSRVLNRPFCDLAQALTAAMAGLDMADLSHTLVGPAAAPAILERVIFSGRKTKAAKVTIKDAVDAFPQDAFNRLGLEESLHTLPDICPVLSAFAKAQAIGNGTAWHASFAKESKLEAAAALEPLALAVQVYRERLLLSAMS